MSAYAPVSQAATLLEEAKGALGSADYYLLRAKLAGTGTSWDTQGFDIVHVGGGKVKASKQENISELDSVETYANTPDLYEAP